MGAEATTSPLGDRSQGAGQMGLSHVLQQVLVSEPCWDADFIPVEHFVLVGGRATRKDANGLSDAQCSARTFLLRLGVA